MKCSKCGNEFEGNFCPNCGAPAQTEQVQQQQPINKKSTAKHRSGRKKLKAGQIVGIVFGSFVLLIFLIGIGEVKSGAEPEHPKSAL